MCTGMGCGRGWGKCRGYGGADLMITTFAQRAAASGPSSERGF